MREPLRRSSILLHDRLHRDRGLGLALGLAVRVRGLERTAHSSRNRYLPCPTRSSGASAHRHRRLRLFFTDENATVLPSSRSTASRTSVAVSSTSERFKTSTTASPTEPCLRLPVDGAGGRCPTFSLQSRTLSRSSVFVSERCERDSTRSRRAPFRSTRCDRPGAFSPRAHSLGSYCQIAPRRAPLNRRRSRERGGVCPCAVRSWRSTATPTSAF